jgi:hypothetical protein
MKKVLIFLVLSTSAACGDNVLGPAAKHSVPVIVDTFGPGGGASVVEREVADVERDQEDLTSSVAPVRANVIFLQFANGTFQKNKGLDICSGLNPPAVSCDSTCQRDILSKVSNDFSNPLYGRIPFNVTLSQPADSQPRKTVVITSSGDFCGWTDPGTGGVTPTPTGWCTSDQTYNVSYIFEFGRTDRQNLADAIAHEVGHQYILEHTTQPTGNDIMGPNGPDGSGIHCFSWGSVSTTGDQCGRATQDSFQRLLDHK